MFEKLQSQLPVIAKDCKISWKKSIFLAVLTKKKIKMLKNSGCLIISVSCGSLGQLLLEKCMDGLCC